MPAARVELGAKPSDVVLEGLPSLWREVLRAGSCIGEHVAGPVDPVRAETPNRSFVRRKAVPRAVIGDHRAIVEAAVRKLAEILGAHIVMKDLRGVEIDALVELEEVEPAECRQRSEGDQQTLAKPSR